MDDDDVRTVCHVACALVATVAIAPMVRTVTAELNQTIGRTWPFADAHCRVLATPGCAAEANRTVAENAPPAHRPSR